MKKLFAVLIALFAASAIAQSSFSLGVNVSPLTFGHSSVYVQVPPVYIQSHPQVIYAPIVLTPAQVPFYDPYYHGYCAGHQDYMYGRCIENVRRLDYEESRRRQYRR